MGTLAKTTRHSSRCGQGSSFHWHGNYFKQSYPEQYHGLLDWRSFSRRGRTSRYDVIFFREISFTEISLYGNFVENLISRETTFSNFYFHGKIFFLKVKTMIWKMAKRVRKAIRLSVTKNWSRSWTSYSFIFESFTALIFTVAVNIHMKMKCPIDVELCMLEEFHQLQMWVRPSDLKKFREIDIFDFTRIFLAKHGLLWYEPDIVQWIRIAPIY